MACKQLSRHELRWNTQRNHKHRVLKGETIKFQLHLSLTHSATRNSKMHIHKQPARLLGQHFVQLCSILINWSNSGQFWHNINKKKVVQNPEGTTSSLYMHGSEILLPVYYLNSVILVVASLIVLWTGNNSSASLLNTCVESRYWLIQVINH